VTDEPRPQSLSKAEAADRLNVSLRTLHRLLQTGDLEGVRDGPKGGLRPTRASVERRLEQLEAATRAPGVPAEPVTAKTLASAMNGDRTAPLSRKQPAHAAEASSAQPPRVSGTRLVRRATRVGAGLLRRGGGHAMRALRHVAKRPARAARCLIAATLIAGLIALGATRERPGAAMPPDKVTVIVIAAPRGDGKLQRRTRLRCTGSRPVKLYVGRGWRARCARR